ncbi:zinc finger protein 676-like isoform X2 [Xyrauchen texanus]|uniref:zinc finger protein 676-like isoform X2 n=1 Tax=Xyrauchen texanus TaxID=154827 RepID=UPI0022426F29|nr:zinc finger protein 676-like isoform X2 [Xyrauchen texanus]
MEEENCAGIANTGVLLPLSSLRLLVPPLRLISAFMWQVLQQKSVMHYGKLEEFVSMVTEKLPQLLGYRQRVQLMLGLRARMVLELCRDSADVRSVQAHLDQIQIPAPPAGPPAGLDADLGSSVFNFKALVLALIKDPVEKAYFFQEVFPAEYGAQYDTALKELMWELLSSLEKLLPVPDFKKTVSLLSPAPAGLEECMQTDPNDLHALLQQHQLFGGSEGQSSLKGSKVGSVPRSSGDWILSSLSIPPSARVILNPEPVQLYHVQTSSVAIMSPALGQLSSDSIIVTDYTEVELSSHDISDELMEASATHVDGGVEENPSGDGVVENPSGDAVEEIPSGDGVEEIPSRDGVEELLADERSAESGEEPAGGEDANTLHYKPTRCDVMCETVSDAIATASHNEPTASAQDEETQQDALTEDKDRTDATPDAGSDTAVLQEDTSPETNVVQTPLVRKGRGRPRKSVETTDKYPVKPPRRRGRPASVKQENSTEERSADRSVGENKDASDAQSRRSATPGLQTRAPYRTSKSCKTEPTSDASSDNPRARYLCNTCGRKFTRSSDVRRHQLTHTGERPFHCSHCEKTFQHAWDLTKHCRKMHDEAAFTCQLCKSSFLNLRVLTAHHKKEHCDKLPHYCSICGEASPTAAALVQHRKTHSATQQYRCEQCGKGFDTLLQRSVHRQSHLRRRQFKCPQCDKTYTRSTDVKRHQLSHTGERPHQCSFCGKCFTLRTGLQKHLVTHAGERPFKCPHCQKAFTQLSILHRHERMHTGERPYLCSQCGKRFLSHGELIKHDKTHRDERPYSCPQCNKSFKFKRALQEHILSHSGARPYPCNYCKKMFAKPFALNRHHLIHTGERPFSCAHCDRTFLTSNELALHERVHTGERPYCCVTCPRKFRSSSELARHRRSHTQERPHTCSYCPKAYATAAKLKSHVRIHTGEGKTKHSPRVNQTADVQETAAREAADVIAIILD